MCQMSYHKLLPLPNKWRMMSFFSSFEDVSVCVYANGTYLLQLSSFIGFCVDVPGQIDLDAFVMAWTHTHARLSVNAHFKSLNYLCVTSYSINQNVTHVNFHPKTWGSCNSHSHTLASIVHYSTYGRRVEKIGCRLHIFTTTYQTIIIIIIIITIIVNRQLAIRNLIIFE